MRALPSGLAAKLASGVTTLATCWRVTRQDDAVFGFTDHDRDLTFDTVTHAAETGMSAAAWARSLGLAVDTLEASGALSAEMIEEAEIAAGLWDDARLAIWRVDWSAVEDRVLLFSGSIGEVSRGPYAFRAEMRGLAHYLNQDVGRLYTRRCNAELGDARCGIDLGALAEAGAVAEVAANRLLTVTGLDEVTFGDLTGGRLTWSTGANAGLATRVFSHWSNGTVLLELVEPAPAEIAPGDTFSVTPGCDKTAAICQGRFANILNHRGQPFMPGDDTVLSYVTSERDHDGGSFFR